MTMASLRLYKNPYNYPDYGSITAVGSSVPCTPKGIGFKTGVISVASRISDFNDCNYLAITRNGKTTYAWIEDVAVETDNSFTVSYRVDPWRTYRGSVTLGTQFVERSPRETSKFDDLLGGDSDVQVVSRQAISHNANKRFLVVQLRDHPAEGAGEVADTPVQPTPYRFMVREYNPNSWQSDLTILSFLRTLVQNAETNIVTIYSVPFVKMSALGDNTSFRITTPGGDTLISAQNGFKDLKPTSGNNHELLTDRIPIPSVMYDVDMLEQRGGHVNLVIPTAGIISLPLEALKRGKIFIRQDVDIFSGACNYMIEADGQLLDMSVRGSGVSSIPVLSNALETYISQNQNALTTAMIGDVATIATGTTVALATGGIGAGLGAGGVTAGINNIVNRRNSMEDMKSKASNPSAMLGTALAGAFNGMYWLVTTVNRVDNSALVHSNYGYPLNKVESLSFPSSGYIKTQGCNVSSDGTVPRWAIEEINQMFNNGVQVK